LRTAAAGGSLTAPGTATAAKGTTMAVCEVCGNDYRLSFEVHAAGNVHSFDSFECAIHMMAPVCEHCGCKVIGHGVEADGVFFCCAHCAREAGARSADALADHAGTDPD
jgi:Rieske Fe-S protein